MAERDRETVIVTDGGDRGGASGAIMAIVLLLVVGLVLYLIFGTNLLENMTGGGAQDINVDVNLPGGGSK